MVTQTKNFDDNNTFNGVSGAHGAQVTIADQDGSPAPLTETSPGVYEAPAFTAVSGHTYNLTINVSRQVFTATSTMPDLVPLDSLYITERTFFGETNKYATLLYKDPAGRGNAYRYIQYINGVKEKGHF